MSLLKRVEGLERTVRLQAPGEAEDAWREAVGTLVDAIYELQPSDEPVRMDTGSSIALHFPPGWQNTGDKVRGLVQRAAVGDSTTEDLRVIDHLPTLALEAVGMSAMEWLQLCYADAQRAQP